jgi:hypothetical protein
MYAFIVAVGQETLNEQNQQSQQQQIPPNTLLALPSLLLVVSRLGGWGRRCIRSTYFPKRRQNLVWCDSLQVRLSCHDVDSQRIVEIMNPA